jgi:NADH-quinone oxidoreductase subunit H
MTTCLKYLVPISCFLFLGAVLWPLILASSEAKRPVLFGPPVKSVVTVAPTNGSPTEAQSQLAQGGAEATR